MRNILAKRHAAMLAHFASGNVLLAFDYDGTLAPITTRPEQARLRVRTRRLLNTVAHRYPCVVISGRTRRDLTTRLGDIPLWHVFGNHGVESWNDGSAYTTRVRNWVEELENRLSYPGLVIENKTCSVAIHYRRVAQKRAALQAINQAVARLPGSRSLGGRMAVNIIPQGAPHKGIALETARR